MWHPHPGEVRSLIGSPITARTSDGHGPPLGEWGRARRAYRDLIADVDPAAAVVDEPGVVDLRPRGAPTDLAGGSYVLSGPRDLIELRTVVELVTGPGTWPAPPPIDGELVRATLEVARPAPVLMLVQAMEGLVVDRTGMWRTWKTAVELVAATLADVDSLTVEAIVVR